MSSGIASNVQLLLLELASVTTNVMVVVLEIIVPATGICVIVGFGSHTSITVASPV